MIQVSHSGSQDILANGVVVYDPVDLSKLDPVVLRLDIVEIKIENMLLSYLWVLADDE